MYLRPMRAGDARACHRLLPERFAYESDVWSRLPALWERLLRSQQLTGVVLEQPTASGGTWLRGFSTSIFISEAFGQEITGRKIPFLRNRIACGLLDGESLALDAQQIRAANSGDGLRLFLWDNFPSATPPDGAPLTFSDEDAAIATEMVRAAFVMFRGYNLREIILEAYGPRAEAVYTAGGYRLRADYASAFPADDPRPAAQRPYLFGLNRDEARVTPYAYAASLFTFAPPRIGFSPAEQKLLRRALDGLSNDELARDLNLSPHTVKTQWRNIYQRAAAVPDFSLRETPLDHEGRGGEKRRALLAYLRERPSELRPYERNRPL